MLYFKYNLKKYMNNESKYNVMHKRIMIGVIALVTIGSLVKGCDKMKEARENISPQEQQIKIN